jgi:hypothetical protein
MQDTNDIDEDNNILPELEDIWSRMSKHENFYNDIAYYLTSGDLSGLHEVDENKTEFKITLTIGQTNLLLDAIRHYQNNILDSKRWSEVNRRSHFMSGCTEQNCQKVQAKILNL